jgi:pimeloyl-ACP methyl ester carboxylesterase
MATYVIVHGGWGGGWEWTPVARQLRQSGHEVYTPTLTGLGERFHLGSGVGLADHIADVSAVFEFEALSDVVLCGHSYGGMVVTGVADRLPGSIRLLVYLDSFVPNDGQALRDLVPEEFRAAIREVGEEGGGDALPYVEEAWPPEGLIPEEVRSSYMARMRPHPLATMTDSIRLSASVESLPRAFVRCIGSGEAGAEEMMASFAERARGEGWLYRESPTPHDLHLFDPDGTAVILHDLATGST